MTDAAHGMPENRYNPHAWLINDPEIGDGCWIGAFTIIDGIGGLTIGKGCNISCGVHVISHSTAKRCVTEGKYSGIDKARTIIEDFVFIGEHATVLMGAKIGHHSIIAAGAVVKEFSVIPPYSLVAGVPGQIVRNLESEINRWVTEGRGSDWPE